MKRLFLFTAILLLLSSCYTWYTTVQADGNYPEEYCSNLEYIETMTLSPVTTKKVTGNATGGAEVNIMTNYPSEVRLTHSNLTDLAQSKHGEDVMIVNVKWDRKNRKRTGVTFDVVRCKQDL